MKNVFLDTNILVDIIADRQPFSQYAIEIFGASEQGKVKLFTSSPSIATTHYLLKKFVDENSLRVIILELLEFITVIAVDIEVISESLKSIHKDFEDAIQIECALSHSGMNFIVTRNSRDFEKSSIEVLSPEDMCQRL